MEDYKPSRAAVLYETVRKPLVDIGKVVGDFGLVVGTATIAFSILPYLIPSVIAIMNDGKPKQKVSLSEDIAGLLGWGAALAITTIMPEGYQFLYKHGYEEAYLFPIATNVVSLLYEVGVRVNPRLQKAVQKATKKAKQRLVEQHRTQEKKFDLEGRLTVAEEDSQGELSLVEQAGEVSLAQKVRATDKIPT